LEAIANAQKVPIESRLIGPGWYLATLVTSLELHPSIHKSVARASNKRVFVPKAVLPTPWTFPTRQAKVLERKK
jgi:hypothetical protein